MIIIEVVAVSKGLRARHPVPKGSWRERGRERESRIGGLATPTIPPCPADFKEEFSTTLIRALFRPKATKPGGWATTEPAGSGQSVEETTMQRYRNQSISIINLTVVHTKLRLKEYKY